MIRARLSSGQFLLGLTSENLQRLCAGEPIKVDLSDVGGADTVVIVFGLTLATLAADLQAQFGPMPPPIVLPVKGGEPS